MRRPTWLRWPRIPRPEISFRDLHAYGGLALAAYGGWQLSPAWTCVAVGAVLWGMGTRVFVHRKAGP